MERRRDTVELKTLIGRTKMGDVDAFTELTRRYQHMAFGYAFAVLRDFQLAEDAAQEAFIAGYFNLPKLEDAEAFPGWLRGIVRHQCHRILRKRHFEEVPLEAAAGLAAEGWEPERRLEQKETLAGVLVAIETLPQVQREVITLYYVQEHSQREIAAFLDVPVSTVNNRLHAARARLKRRMLAMVEDAFKKNTLPEDFAERVGKIVQVKGPVIEARFDPEDLPGILDALTITDEPRKIDVTVEVAQRLENGVVRCVAPGPVKGLRRGMKVIRAQEPVRMSIEGETLERVVQTLGRPTAGGEATEILETGIKVIDLLCPYVKGGKIGIFGPAGIGKLVLVEEIVHRIASREKGVSLFTFVRAADVDNLREGWTKDPLYTGGTVGAVETFYITSEDATDPERAAAMGFLDSVTFMTRDLAVQKIYPAVDPIVSRSRILEPAVVGPEHWEVAQRAREALRRTREIESAGTRLEDLSEAERALVSRARRLQRFFSQPFFVAEPFTGWSGRTVSREETVRACGAILEGQYDDLPEEAFLYVGGIGEAVAKAKELTK